MRNEHRIFELCSRARRVLGMTDGESNSPFFIH
jgi:hypothetical protein